MKHIFTLLGAACLATAAVHAQPVGIANVFGAKSWEQLQKPPYGMYSFKMGTTPEVTLISENVVPANFGGVYADGVFFAIEGIATTAGSFITNYLYDAESWEKIRDFRGENVTAFDMAWDNTSGNVYGYFHNFDSGEEYFGTIDIYTGTTTRIGTLPFVAYGMGCDVEGQLYAMSNTGDFYSIDKTSGTSLKIASTPCASAWTTSGAIDSSTRTFYYACCGDSQTTLYGVNLDSGQATLLQTVPDNMELTGLYFPQATALPGAPARAEDVAFDFENGNLTGNITFRIPATLAGGGAASGTANYTVTLDGNEIASADAAYGTQVSVPASVSATGEYTATVTLKNSVGSAPTARLKAWIGPDVPAPVGKVEITYDGNGEFTLTWPEATAAHGGWFNPATVTYNVMRYSSDSDEPTTYTGLTDCSFVNTVSLPYEDEYATYHYNVAAVFDSTVGSYTSSEFYTIGSIEPPFYEPFNARYDLGKFTIFEGESKDWNRWSYDNKAVSLTTSGSAKSDDYLLLPPLMLEQYKSYTISFDAKGKYASDTETFEVLAGLAPTAEALTEKVMETVELKSTEYVSYSADFIPAASGAYFIGIHATSAPYKGSITIDNIRVSAGVDTGIDTIDADGRADGRMYDLMGREIRNPLPGTIYIQNGRKHIAR